MVDHPQHPLISPATLELPGSPLPLDSPLYIDRPPIESLAYQEICKPGSLLRLKAPKHMGKSSLLERILALAASQGYSAVGIDFQVADGDRLASLDQCLRWMCANISQQLGLKPNLQDHWDPDLGSKSSCTHYLETYVLKQIDGPLLLTLNEVNRIFEFPRIAQDLFSLLRFWHERAKRRSLFQTLRLVSWSTPQRFTSS